MIPMFFCMRSLQQARLRSANNINNRDDSLKTPFAVLRDPKTRPGKGVLLRYSI